MMGVSHATTGVAGWLVIQAGMAHLGHPQPWPTVVVGAAVTGGAALLPDLDHPDSTVAHALGPITRNLARGVAWTSGRVKNVTRTRRDKAAPLMHHRGLTHTLGAALAVGGILASACTVTGWAMLAVTAVTAGLLWRSLGVPRHAYIAGPTVAAVAWWVTHRHPADWLLLLTHPADAVAAYGPTYPLGWVGAAVGVGMAIHNLGDACTVQGVPLFAPFLPIRGKLWWDIRLMPVWMCLHTDSALERWGVPIASAAIAGVAARILTA